MDMKQYSNAFIYIVKMEQILTARFLTGEPHPNKN